MQTQDREKQFRAEFSQRLREAIEQSSYTYQKDFQEAAGISNGTLKNWLSGTFMPGVYDLKRMSDLLGVDALWLGFGVGSIHDSQESLRQLLTRHHALVTKVLADVREFSTQRGLSNETAATMFIDYLDTEIQTSKEKQAKAS